MSIQAQVDRLVNHHKKESEALRKIAKKITKVPNSITIPTEYMA